MDEAWMIMDKEGWLTGGGGCSPRSLNWLFVGLNWRGEVVDIEEGEEGNRRRWLDDIPVGICYRALD